VTADRVPSRVEADGAGGLTYQGSCYLLVRPETLVALQKAVEAVLGERAAACLAAGGRAGGGTALQALEGAAEEIVARLLAMGGEIGWARSRSSAPDRTSWWSAYGTRRSPGRTAPP